MKKFIIPLILAIFQISFGYFATALADDTDSNWLGMSERPRWSPDGSKITFESTRDGNFEIYIMDADGSNQTRLTHNPWVDQNPVFSPDGTKLAFHSKREGFGNKPTLNQIYIMDISGENVEKLTNESFTDQDPNRAKSNNIEPNWLKSGEILFLSNRSNGWNEIYIMNGDGSAVKRVTYDRQNHWNIIVGPDDKTVYFEVHKNGLFSRAVGDGGWDVHSIELTERSRIGRNLTNVTNNPAFEDYDSSISPNGKKILFKRSGFPGLFIMNADGTNQKSFYEKNAFSAQWSPDGSKIAFTTDRDGNREIYIMDADGTNERRLTISRDE